MKEHDFSHLHEGCKHIQQGWCCVYGNLISDINFKCKNYEKKEVKNDKIRSTR